MAGRGFLRTKLSSLFKRSRNPSPPPPVLSSLPLAGEYDIPPPPYDPKDGFAIEVNPRETRVGYSGSSCIPLSQSSKGRGIADDCKVVIAVMGATGSGKTTFINMVSGSNLTVGQGLASCTDTIGISLPFLLDERLVTLIDTPGFDDTQISDTEILKMIAEYLASSYKDGTELTGIVYIHRISDFRMGGTSVRNFSIFRKLCGDSTLKNVVILTNMWSEVSKEAGGARELQLANENLFFRSTLEKGAKMLRHDGSLASAQTVVRYLLGNKPSTLQIQREIVDQKKDILHTSAGKETDRVAVEEKRRNEEEINALRRKHQGAKGKQRRQEVKAVKEALKERMAEAREQSNRVASNLRKERSQLQRSARAMEMQAERDARRLEKLDAKLERMTCESQLLASNAQKYNARLRQEMREVRARPSKMSSASGIATRRSQHPLDVSIDPKARASGDPDNWQEDSEYDVSGEEDEQEDENSVYVDANSEDENGNVESDDDTFLQLARLADIDRQESDGCYYEARNGVREDENGGHEDVTGEDDGNCSFQRALLADIDTHRISSSPWGAVLS
ncbi:hypothetical protein NMY22_g3858 [Coprinellus aureogranulatus]|nr:hypothetical protein NMY22_g3858 [Coprinellus aureogranulatus]